MKASEKQNKREPSRGKTGNINLPTAVRKEKKRREKSLALRTQECRARSRGMKVALCLREKAIERVCFHYRGKVFVQVRRLSGATARKREREESTEACKPFPTQTERSGPELSGLILKVVQIQQANKSQGDLTTDMQWVQRAPLMEEADRFIYAACNTESAAFI